MKKESAIAAAWGQRYHTDPGHPATKDALFKRSKYGYPLIKSSHPNMNRKVKITLPKVSIQEDK